MKHELSNLYGQKFFRGRARYHWRSSIVCGIINYIWLRDHLKSAIDVGAGAGDLVKGFLDLGYDAYGIEGVDTCLQYAVCPRERMVIHDLRIPIDMPAHMWTRFDICTCWEVAEHIEEEFSNVFCDNLCLLSDRLLMSACPPNPSGHPSKGSVGHFNEQPYEYWEGKFKIRGYSRHPKIEKRFRELVSPWRSKYGIKAFYDNVLYFQRSGK